MPLMYDTPENDQPYVSVVVPVYNERENIQNLHHELTVAVAGLACEIIYVDDGSNDGSWDLLVEQCRASAGGVQALRLRRNFGQTAALAAGFDVARGKIIVPIDADLQNDPQDIPKLLSKIEAGYDVVSGWRAQRQDAFVSRKLPSRLANGLISWITGVRLHDYGCTLKAYRREIIDNIQLYGEMHRFLPALAHWAGARVTEITVNHRPRVHGKSKYGIGRTTRVVLDLITVKFLLSYSTKPLHIFGIWGLCSMLVGLISGLITAWEKFGPMHLSVNRNGWFLLSIFFGMAGIQFICLGLLGEIIVRTYYESQKKAIYAVRERFCQDPQA
jgi:glycosyltransferase involved in cell wall biosynthesis